MNKIAVIGFGAVGASFGFSLYRTFGKDFAVFASKKHAEHIRNGIGVNGTVIKPAVISSRDDNFIPDFLLISVKNYDLEEAICMIKNVTDSHTVLLPILNGISATDILKKEFPENEVLCGFARIMAIRRKDRSVIFSGGHIFFGDAGNDILRPSVQLVKNIFDSSGIRNTVPDDIQREIWNKFMINIGTNQISAVTGADYPHLKNIPEQFGLMRQAMLETVRVAQAYGIHLCESDIDTYCDCLNDNQKGLKTSTLQDVENHRRTEIDYFSGTLIKYAEAKNIEVPVNRVLYALIKSIEKMYLS
jgi:2-dehydropantoate 2-reductase